MINLFEEQLDPYRKKLKEQELDSDEHGPLALEMLNDLCGSDKKKLKEALDYSKKQWK